MAGCLQVVKEVKAYKRASYIAFLFFTTKNNNFKIKRKYVFRENLGKVCENSPVGENPKYVPH